mgnify:CR=1 FL=1
MKDQAESSNLMTLPNLGVGAALCVSAAVLFNPLEVEAGGWCCGEARCSIVYQAECGYGCSFEKCCPPPGGMLCNVC